MKPGMEEANGLRAGEKRKDGRERAGYGGGGGRETATTTTDAAQRSKGGR